MAIYLRTRNLPWSEIIALYCFVYFGYRQSAIVEVQHPWEMRLPVPFRLPRGLHDGSDEKYVIVIE
jgi:hypothetical protein